MNIQKVIEQKENDNKHKPLNIIEDYVSSESTGSPSKSMNIAPSLPAQSEPKTEAISNKSNDTSQSQSKSEIQSQSQSESQVTSTKAAVKPKLTESITNAEDGDKNKTTENENDNIESKPTKGGSETAQYNPVMCLLLINDIILDLYIVSMIYDIQSTVEQWRRKAQEYDEVCY